MMRRVFLAAALWACSLSLWADIRYVEVTSVASAPSVRVSNIEDLQFLIRHHKVEIGYLLRGSDNPSEVRLVVIGDGTYFFFDMNGYSSIETYLAGTAGNFLDGADYQEASGESGAGGCRKA